MEEARRSAAIRNLEGLHVRPATLITHLANSFPCQVLLGIAGCTVNAKSALEVLTLAAAGRRGVRVEVAASGERAEEAAQAIAELIESGFGETV
jgi:phosphotransferase system HPr (HPr) family protein